MTVGTDTRRVADSHEGTSVSLGSAAILVRTIRSSAE
jgi:hypothetical protein